MHTTCMYMHVYIHCKNDPGVCVADLVCLCLSTHLQQVMPHASTCMMLPHAFDSLAQIHGADASQSVCACACAHHQFIDPFEQS